MKALTFFILGIVFIQWCIPLGDSLIELIITWFELLKGKAGVKITKYNVAITKMKDELDAPIANNLIGFQVDSTEEDEEEYEEDE